MSDFNPKHQEVNISSKIAAGLERISEAFKVLLWEKAKALGLSPIQIQILIFISYHKSELCSVSHLAKEFNVTKPTISDAIRVLLKKSLIIKDFSPEDHRSYRIFLSEKGKIIVQQTESFAQPISQQLSNFRETELNNLFKSISTLIYKLHQSGILSIQRTCYACKFYTSTSGNSYCKLLEASLKTNDIRLDCPEFEEAV